MPHPPPSRNIGFPSLMEKRVEHWQGSSKLPSSATAGVFYGSSDPFIGASARVLNGSCPPKTLTKAMECAEPLPFGNTCGIIQPMPPPLCRLLVIFGSKHPIRENFKKLLPIFSWNFFLPYLTLGVIFFPYITPYYILSTNIEYSQCLMFLNIKFTTKNLC
jgi:hypothetical protein